ncbi:MAG TPA: hypothetical protein DDY49_03320 [Paenibacillaceae bacterium]|nr:hypothetical protein [Paenibacillaceae bacterium]
MSNNNVSPICKILRTLDPGTPFASITVQGSTKEVKILACFDAENNIATFIYADGNLEIVNCNEISSFELRNI